ncbi:UNKNOWN [Stylonychia lemnae]|uniref:Cyclin-like domain-containing protein n=1 Tax=Stylonychia lemnae TaxID=5949 RepID=A0A078AJ26_STYLE|nr:UNKNOWN [Stylonychia lemnae]|eukprot:CDW81472.1 UNKNOWN [Stylonychia lemnae]
MRQSLDNNHSRTLIHKRTISKKNTSLNRNNMAVNITRHLIDESSLKIQRLPTIKQKPQQRQLLNLRPMNDTDCSTPQSNDQLPEISQNGRSSIQYSSQHVRKPSNIGTEAPKRVYRVPQISQFANGRKIIPSIEQIKLSEINFPESAPSSPSPRKKMRKLKFSLEEVVIKNFKELNSHPATKNLKSSSAQSENLEFSEMEKGYSKHKLTEYNRAKMVDWMIQVYNVFGKSTEKTLFTAISIMDRYILRKEPNEKIENLNDHYHLIGIVCVWLGSKLEDTKEIQFKQIYRDAGHAKFRKQQILDMEADILRTLNFNLIDTQPYEESMTLLKLFQYDGNKKIFEQDEIQRMQDILKVLSLTNAHGFIISSEKKEKVWTAQVILAIRLLALINNKKGINQSAALTKEQKEFVKDTIKAFRKKNGICKPKMHELKEINKKIISSFMDFERHFDKIRNMIKDNQYYQIIKQAFSQLQQ